MTWFNIRKRKIVLECVTDRTEVTVTAPISRAGSFLPRWWKDLPKSVTSVNGLFDAPTMKSCVGMLQGYAHGVILPLWSDLAVHVGAQGSAEFYYQFADTVSRAESHMQGQRGDFMPEHNFLHLKLAAPWMIHCDEDVNFMFVEPTWNTPAEASYRVLPGVVNYKYQNSANVNTIFTRTNAMRKIQLSLGQPLAHIVPIDNRPVEVKLIFDEHRYKEMYEKNARRPSFLDAYKKRRIAFKALETNCPYPHEKFKEKNT